MPEYTVNDAKVKAEEYCKQHPDWELICNIEDTDTLSLSFSELPKSEQKQWRLRHHEHAEDAWSEFGIAPSRHPFKHVSGAGELFDTCLNVPMGHQSMMIFNTAITRKGGYAY